MQKAVAGAAAVGLAAALYALWRRKSRDPPPPNAALLTSIEAVVFDCDGVIYKNAVAIPGIPEALSALRAAGKRIIFVTNAASASRASLAKKLAKLGIAGVTEKECVTSAWAAAQYLSTHHPNVKRAYVVGGGGLFDELQLVNIEPVGGNDNDMGLEALHASGGLEASLPIDAVVAGMQPEGLCYARLAKASAYARDRKRPFVGTNPDNTWPGGATELLPAGGCNVKYVSFAADREPDAIVGKPRLEFAQLVAQLHGLKPGTTLMVGDRCNTDIAFGNGIGWKTMLVLSGCHSRADIAKASSVEVPDYVADSVADLAACL